MIIIDSLTKIYDTDLFKKKHIALNNTSFTIKPGTITGFLGPNGAGKTTTIKIVLDFIRSTSGDVRYSDLLGGDLHNALKNIGYAPERPYFYPHLYGKEFIFYLGKLCGLKNERIQEQINYWAPRLKIDHALNRKLSAYSKGMLQRIGFLSAIIHSPKLLILDEPASGLDPLGRKELKDVIKEVHSKGTSVFFSTHIVSDVEEICENLVFIKDGKCVYEGPIEELITKYALKQYQVNYYENKKLESKTIDSDGLQLFLKTLLDQQRVIHSVEPHRMTLEEIIYQTSESK